MIVRAMGDSAVVTGVSFVPEVYYTEDGKYYPICGHYFWDSNWGATLVCNVLGFQFGTCEATEVSYNIDAMPVGRCTPDIDFKLDACTGGGNDFGNFNYHDGWCRQGNNIGVRVVCSQITSPTESSTESPTTVPTKSPTESSNSPNTYTPLTDSNIKTAALLWVSDQAAATSTYGLVDMWNVAKVTDMSYSKSIYIVKNELK
jgi:hypothetical protein